MTDDPYADLVARLTGADPDRLLPVDALRLYDSDQATFPLSAEDAEGVLDVIDEAADAILKLQGEVARCHERLEIDHYFKMGDNDDSDLERVDIPMSERASFPDAVRARDATIGLIEENNRDLRTRLEAAEAEVARMREIIEQITQECLSEDDGPVEQLEHILGIVSALQPGERT